MLIPHPRHTPKDLALWNELQGCDRMGANAKLMARAAAARQAIVEFARRGPCYLGVSWGKDSVVLAHISLGTGVPLAWVRQDPLANPDCPAVRDGFLERFGQQVDYQEIAVQMVRGENTWHATGSLEDGFKEARQTIGERHISGIRADESGGRTIRARRWGVSSKNACAPLIYWKVKHIFAYLALYDLPVHPAYGMLGGGRWERDHLRVCSLGGQRGAGFGRDEWEKEYYGEHLRRLGHER